MSVFDEIQAGQPAADTFAPMVGRTTDAVPSGWIECLREDARSEMQLLLFHYAGASANVFRPWLEDIALAADVAVVQLPGRERRSAEPFLTNVEDVVEQSLALIRPLLDRPTIFFGHSIGALIAFEIIRRLQAEGQALPSHFVVSGRRAPQLASSAMPMHLLPDAEFIERLKHYDGTPDAILRDPGLMAYFLPRLRADFAISETYRYKEGPLLTCPVTVLAGDQDQEAPLASVYEWRYQTSSEFRFFRLKGGHFFINSDRQAVMDVIKALIERHSRAPLHRMRAPTSKGESWQV